MNYRIIGAGVDYGLAGVCGLATLIDFFFGKGERAIEYLIVGMLFYQSGYLAMRLPKPRRDDDEQEAT